MMASNGKILRPPFAWFGGKHWLAKRIHRYMPLHQRYVDLFAGSASILFAKPRSPVEVINDLDSGVVNFYRVLRNPVKFRSFKSSCLLRCTVERSSATARSIGRITLMIFSEPGLGTSPFVKPEMEYVARAGVVIRKAAARECPRM